MEKKRTCYLFVFNGYSDWEPALAITGLNNYSDVAIKTFSLDGKSIESMGDVKVQPDLKMSDVHLTATDLLLLPGGELWEQGGNLETIPHVEQAIKEGTTVAAIWSNYSSREDGCSRFYRAHK